MNKLNVFAPENYPEIPPRHHRFVYSFSPPGLVRVRGKVKEDTRILDTNSDCWELAYGGIHKNIDWGSKLLEGVDDSLIALWRHHLTDEIQKKAPLTVRAKFRAFLGFCRELDPRLSLVSLLAVFCRLYIEGRHSEFTYLRAFYNWGVRGDIEIFDARVRKILDDLPAPSQNAYSSIFLQQNYVTPDQEARILMCIDGRLSKFESYLDKDFDQDSYIGFRDAVLALFVYELAPRPMQVYTANRGDLNDIGAKDQTEYYSIRLVRNKNRHDNKTYTSLREISARLGRALEKLKGLNGRLFSTPDRDDIPLFLDRNGKRMPSTAVSNVLSEVLESAVGDDGLSVAGATTPFRHHLGQSLADQGAPAAVIADRLGHSTEVAARAYITATPNIAKIKSRALGENGTYRELMHALLTGEIIERKDVKNESQLVRGTIGMHYIESIGSCDVDGHCGTNPIYSCYTCRKFHPFVDGPHDEVVNALQKEAIKFLESTMDLQHSRPLLQLELTIEAAKAVLEECRKHAPR